MEYIDKIYVYLSKSLQTGQKVKIEHIATNPENFILAVKRLIDEEFLTDIEFSNDYKYIRKQTGFPVKKKEVRNDPVDK